MPTRRTWERINTAVLVTAFWLLTVLIAITIFGCSSPTQAISDAAVRAEGRFDNISQRAVQGASETAEEQSYDGFIQIQGEADAGKGEAQAILGAVPKVEDKATWLDRFGRFILWGIGGLAALAFIAYFGRPIADLMRTFIGWIPQKDRQTASVLRKLQDPNDPLDEREAVAVIRSKNPAIDRAYEDL